MLFLFLSPLLRLLGVVCSCYSEKEREGKRLFLMWDYMNLMIIMQYYLIVIIIMIDD